MADPKMKPRIYGPGWEEVEPLRAGGQGEVFLVRTPESVKQRSERLRVLKQSIQVISSIQTEHVKDEAVRNLSSAINSYTSQDEPANFGALKLFEITGDGPEAEKAMGRLESEVRALSEISHPSILKLRDADVRSRWMITEYHPNGSLAAKNNRDRFTGNVQASLEAFRPLVEAVSILHGREPKIIHRDIKPENIFVGSDGRLILGDFGIVFFQDESKARLTSTVGEKVGTAEWMAPWANVRERLDEPNPTFDIFPLGKVLWWMVSGKPIFPFWYHPKEQYNLKTIYPRNPDMVLVNRILDRCVVEEEKDCLLLDAKSLLEMIDEALKVVCRGGQLLADGVPRPCRICGKGEYIGERDAHLYRMELPFIAEVFRCNACGHIQMFATKRHGA